MKITAAVHITGIFNHYTVVIQLQYFKTCSNDLKTSREKQANSMSSRVTSDIYQWQSSLRHYPMFLPIAKSSVSRTREDFTRKAGLSLSSPPFRRVVKETLRVPDKASRIQYDLYWFGPRRIPDKRKV